MKKTSLILALAVSSLLTACASNNGVLVDTPSARGNVTIALVEETTARTIAAKLQSNGFEISSIRPDLVVAVTQRPAFVDCGTITQVRNGNRSQFPGATPLAVIYTDPDSQAFLTREVSVTTSARVALAGNRATVFETHDTTLIWTPSNSSQRARETKRVSAGETVTFSDNTTCATGSSVADILR